MKTENLLEPKQVRELLRGEELRKLRNDVCFSQEYMAQQLSISQSTYQRLESGEIKISSQRLSQLVEIFDKPIDKFSKKGYMGLQSSAVDKEIERLQVIIIRQEKQIEKLERQLKNSRLA